jgi:hypothetical protein
MSLCALPADLVQRWISEPPAVKTAPPKDWPAWITIQLLACVVVRLPVMELPEP